MSELFDRSVPLEDVWSKSGLEESDDSLDNQFDEVFASAKPVENFAQLLATSDKRKFTVLSRAIQSLPTKVGDESDNRAFFILQSVLHLTIHTHQISADGISDLTSCVFAETRHLTTNVLSKVVTNCLDYLKSHDDSDIPARWIEIFGKLVSILSTRSEIQYDGDEFEGREYQAAVVNQLCRLNWGWRNTPYLISAIREFPELDKNEMDTVIGKAAQAIKELEPSAIPPIAYQLLQLATEKKPGQLLEIFDQYFHGMILDNELELISVQAQSKRSALGTVVYHFIQAARHSSNIVREIIKRIRNSCDDHNLLMTPFIMSLSLGLTSIDHMKPQVMDLLRRSIVNSWKDVHNTETSAWYRSARGEFSGTVMGCFRSVIDSKSSELDFLLDGLKDVGLVLLNMDDVQSETYHTAANCRELGGFIIEALVKRKHHYFPKVMNELLKAKSSVHIDCLASCLRALIRTIVQSTMSGRINELIHHLPLMTVDTATPVIKALIPAFQLSRNLLDEMIMVVRKTIWKSTEARKVSVQAMVLLLSNSRIVGAQRSRSQYSESQPIAFTQPTQANIMENTNENECLCYELLSILKRFFSQNSEVRERLYLGLHVVSRKNPELIEVICSHLQSQVKQHMDELCTEIRMNNLLDFTNAELTAAEDLGLLLQSLSFVTLRGRRIANNDSENEVGIVAECEDLLDAWVSLLSRIELRDIEVQASSLLGAGSASNRPTDSVRHVRNALILQLLHAMEALMEYLALRGNTEDDQKIMDLFNKFLELEPRLAPPPKPTKMDKDKKDKSTTKTRAKNKKDKSKTKSKSNVTTSDAASVGTHESGKKTKLKQEPPKTFVVVHILNLESILEILKSLYSSDDDVLKLVRKHKRFERFILKVIKQKVERLKNNESLRERDRKTRDVLLTLACIARALWQESCKIATENSESIRMEIDDDSDVQVLDGESTSVETFRFEIILDLVEFLNNHSSIGFLDFLKNFNDYFFEDMTSDGLFENFFQIWADVVNKCTMDGKKEKSLEHLFTILDILSKSLSSESTAVSNQVLKWCINYGKVAKDTIVLTRELCALVVQAILTVGSKLLGKPEEIFMLIAKKCHYVLGDVDQDTQMPTDVDEDFWLIDIDTAPIIITTIGLYIERDLGLVTAIIKRLKAQSHYYDFEKLSDLRDKTCVMLTFLINLSTELIRSCFPTGPCVDILLKLLAQIFITTTLFTEHLIEIYSKNKVEFAERKFASLVKLIGKDFKIRVEGLISHIEGIEREEASELCKSSKNKGKVPAAMKQKFLKDAKTIPAMVYHVEKYEQQLILLCQKTKVNLLAGTKLSTARDFRIEVTKLKALADTTGISKKKKKKAQKRARDASPETISSDDYSNNSSTIQQSGLSKGRKSNNDSRPARSDAKPLSKKKKK